MKISYLLFFFFFGHFTYCQFNESFSVGNFNKDPYWQGDTSFFTINNAGQLQSQGSSSSPIYIATRSDKIKNTIWEFWVHISFEPSSSNYPKVYLCSDSSNLKGSLHGYFVKVGGESGTSDGIDLYKQNGTSVTKLIDGVSGHAGKPDNILRIKVIRDNLGNWNLFSDTTGEKSFISEGEVFDTSFTQSGYCGIVYTFTTTRKNQFYFDEFSIAEAPLKAEKVLPVSPTEIEVVFNSTVDIASGQNMQNYSLEELGIPIKAVREKDQGKVKLTFSQKLLDGNYNLEISNVSDTTGRFINDQNISFYFKKPVEYGDLIITEIYPDPDPSNGLPGEEFVELFNASADTINLMSFTLSDPSTTASLPDIKIDPSSYLILTSNDGFSGYKNYGNVVALNPWPSLNNSGDQIILKDNHQKMISEVNYSDNWYEDSQKKEGGWTLEMININELCKNDLNWKASQDSSGGTPGKRNSVFSSISDLDGPALLNYSLLDSNKIFFRFNEPLDSSSVLDGFLIPDNSVSSIKFINALDLTIQWNNAFKEGKETELIVTGIKDCLGNIAKGASLKIVRPSKEDSMDIIINEILFNPKPGGVDFVEIYNRSAKIIDLSNWSIANMKGDTLYQKNIISVASSLIMPYEYRAICISEKILQGQYSVPYPDRIIEVASMPSFNDDKGVVILLGPTGNQIDKFCYSESYHSPLIKDKEGVSLERLAFYAPTNNQSNWYSASSASGFATPGYQNSEHEEGHISKGFEITPKVISPDGDNFRDLAYINYQFQKPGQICNLKVFNSEGVLIKRLADNQLAGEQGFFFWDGSDDKGEIVETGIYILTFDAFDPGTGASISYKESLVVANHF